LTARTWRQLTQASAVPGYGYRYRRWLLDSLKYVDARDLASGGDHIPELVDVYVDLGLVSRAQLQRPGTTGSPAGGQAAEDTPERHSISELLSNRSRVVIALAGQPGSGKSTVLAYAARRTAARPWSGRRPVTGRAGNLAAGGSASCAGADAWCCWTAWMK